MILWTNNNVTYYRCLSSVSHAISIREKETYSDGRCSQPHTHWYRHRHTQTQTCIRTHRHMHTHTHTHTDTIAGVFLPSSCRQRKYSLSAIPTFRRIFLTLQSFLRDRVTNPPSMSTCSLPDMYMSHNALALAAEWQRSVRTMLPSEIPVMSPWRQSIFSVCMISIESGDRKYWVLLLTVTFLKIMFCILDTPLSKFGILKLTEEFLRYWCFSDVTELISSVCYC